MAQAERATRKQRLVPTWAIHATITVYSLGLLSAVVFGQWGVAVVWAAALSAAFSWLMERKWGAGDSRD